MLSNAGGGLLLATGLYSITTGYFARSSDHELIFFVRLFDGIAGCPLPSSTIPQIAFPFPNGLLL